MVKQLATVIQIEDTRPKGKCFTQRLFDPDRDAGTAAHVADRVRSDDPAWVGSTGSTAHPSAASA